MAISFDTVPKKLSLTGNPILFYLSTTLDFTGKTNVYIKLKISFTFEGATKEFTDQIAIDETLKAATFDVSDILRNHIKTVYRWAESIDEMIIDRSNDMLLNFTVEAWEHYYNTSTEAFESEAVSTPASNNFYAIDGGLDPEQEAVLRSGGSSFYDLWIVSKKKFLTLTPQTQIIHPSQIVKLYWFCEETFSGSVEIVFEHTAGDITGNIYNDFEENHLYEILLSPALLTEKISLFDTENYFKVQISGSRSEQKQFNIKYDYYRRNDFFMLKSSLGGIDSIWARGHRSSKLISESDTYRVLEHNNNIFNPKFNQNRGLVNKNNTSYIGFIEGDEQAQYYQELLNTDMLMVMDGKYPIRVIRLTNDLELQNDENNGLYEIPFKWKPAYNSRFYSSPLRNYYEELDNYLTGFSDVTISNGDTQLTA